MTRASFAAACRAAAFDPTATIFPPVIATACATESRASTVRIFPLIRRKFSGSDAAHLGPGWNGREK